jgi:hypothetical protein
VTKIEWTLNDEPLEVSNLYLAGLKDVQGTYIGRLDMDSGLTELFSNDGGQMIYIYAPRHGNLIQHWFWTIRERLFGIAYPSELLFNGPTEFTITEPGEDGNVTATGTFRWPPSE